MQPERVENPATLWASMLPVMPVRLMDPAMGGACRDFQVAGPVVPLVAVAVMRHLAAPELPAELALQDEPRLVDPTAFVPDHLVALRADRDGWPTLIGPREIVASDRAEAVLGQVSSE
jgi:hypothetical protein